MGKVPKGKGKTRAKMENLENVLRSKITNRQTAFKLRFEAIVLCSNSGSQRGASPAAVAFTEVLLLLLKEWYSFFPLRACLLLLLLLLLFFRFFFNQELSSAFDISMSKYFSTSKELPRVNFDECGM